MICRKFQAKFHANICVLSFCCISRSNERDSVMMLESTQETLLIKESIVSTVKLQQAVRVGFIEMKLVPVKASI
jgi:hypothetical protein